MYVEQLSFVLHGTLDAAAYERAWQAVVDRHAGTAHVVRLGR